ncbi:MAG: amidase [Alphaproteobacteria bacterium]|nr:amidase [Alphaproteobacteria bacterium]
MSLPLHHLTIAEASRRIAARELSPVELTKAVLDRIAAVDGRLNSYVLVTPERAIADARAAEAEIMAGRWRGPLHGIPVGIKDIYATAGIRTTCHSHLLMDNVPTEDAVAVARLGAAGAVLMGKLATHEFAFGGPDWTLPFPPARNPWNTDRFTGGSSSGSGAAVAAGLCLGALGSDTAGSIRTPSAFCGIAGIKPSYGLVSRRGVAPLAWSLDHIGPMAWTAEDAGLMLQAIAGHDPGDPASATVPLPDYAAALDGDVRGLRIGVVRHFHERDDRADADIAAGIDGALRTLAERGAVVEDVTLSPLQDYSAACVLIMNAEALAVHERDLKATPEKYGWIFRDRMTLATFVTAADYVQATRLRRILTAEADAALARCDVLVCAVIWSAAPAIETIPPYGMFRKPMLTGPFNLTGHPAMSVCTGFSADGMPLAMQIVGRRFDEATVLRVADAYEKATPWRDRRPPL